MKIYIAAMFGLLAILFSSVWGELYSAPLADNHSYSLAQNEENNNMTIVLPARDEDKDVPDSVDQNSAGDINADGGNWNTGFELETNFNTKDWMLGFGLGMEHSTGFSLLLRFQVRPLTNEVFVEKSPTVYRQYNERRMVLGLSAGWDYIIYNGFGIYLTAGYGVSFAYFRGSDQNPETIWTPMPGGGIMFEAWDNASFKCGYEYIRTPDYPDHHINLSAVFMF